MNEAHDRSRLTERQPSVTDLTQDSGALAKFTENARHQITTVE
jgi:hypothetical protein